MTGSAPTRRAISVGTKLAVALRKLGVKPSEIDWSHEPALGLRAINDAGTDYVPAQHDPDYIFIRSKPEHSKLTNKDNGTGRSDKGAIAHVRHLTKDQEEFRRRLLAKGADAARPKSRWGSRKLQSRPFQKRRAST